MAAGCAGCTTCVTLGVAPSGPSARALDIHTHTAAISSRLRPGGTRPRRFRSVGAPTPVASLCVFVRFVEIMRESWRLMRGAELALSGRSNTVGRQRPGARRVSMHENVITARSVKVLLAWLVACTLLACQSEAKQDAVLPGVESIVFAKRAYIEADGKQNVSDGAGRVVDYQRYTPGGGVFVLTPPTP